MHAGELREGSGAHVRLLTRGGKRVTGLSAVEHAKFFRGNAFVDQFVGVRHVGCTLWEGRSRSSLAGVYPCNRSGETRCSESRYVALEVPERWSRHLCSRSHAASRVPRLPSRRRQRPRTREPICSNVRPIKRRTRLGPSTCSAAWCS